MIKLSRFADYGIVLLTYIANQTGDCEAPNPVAARTLAEASRLPLPTVSKVLKALARDGLLTSHRGKQGGYTLARPPEQVSVAEMIAAVDGPITLTDCGDHAEGLCDFEPSCPVSANWQRISDAVRDALEGLTLADMLPVASGSTLVKVHRSAADGERMPVELLRRQ